MHTCRLLLFSRALPGGREEQERGSVQWTVDGHSCSSTHSSSLAGIPEQSTLGEAPRLSQCGQFKGDKEEFGKGGDSGEGKKAREKRHSQVHVVGDVKKSGGQDGDGGWKGLQGMHLDLRKWCGVGAVAGGHRLLFLLDRCCGTWIGLPGGSVAQARAGDTRRCSCDQTMPPLTTPHPGEKVDNFTSCFMVP